MYKIRKMAMKLSKFSLNNETKLFLIFLLVYGFFMHWTGWEEESRFSLTKSIVENGTLNIDNYYFFSGDLAYYNGHYYSDKMPGISLGCR